MTLYDEMLKNLPDKLSIPEEFRILFDWMENNHYTMVTQDGNYIAGLNDPNDDLYSEDEEGNEIVYGGTSIYFSAQDQLDFEHYKKEYGDLSDRIYTFARTGGDGSHAAFWLDDDGNQKIVHIGSGSGSTLFCVIANTPLDFIRLLAIGYEEICWLQSQAGNSLPPNQDDADDTIVYPNKKFQEWVVKTFNTTIPVVASEILPNPSLMDDESSDDPFWNWNRKNSLFW